MPYAIMVTWPNGNETELCRVNSNPEAVAEGARRKVTKIKHWRTVNGRRQPRYIDVPQYSNVRVEKK
jgi:hypothetical protein